MFSTLLYRQEEKCQRDEECMSKEKEEILALRRPEFGVLKNIR